jgi:hypothetical protein
MAWHIGRFFFLVGDGFTPALAERGIYRSRPAFGFGFGVLAWD